jgi:transposase-like protein
MGENNYQQFFTRPADLAQRRYECLRAVFVDEIPMKDVAEQFDVAYGTVRNWAHKFRAARDQGASPPFFLRPRADVPRRRIRPNLTRRSRRSPTPKRCR